MSELLNWLLAVLISVLFLIAFVLRTIDLAKDLSWVGETPRRSKDQSSRVNNWFFGIAFMFSILIVLPAILISRGTFAFEKSMNHIFSQVFILMCLCGLIATGLFLLSDFIAGIIKLFMVNRKHEATKGWH